MFIVGVIGGAVLVGAIANYDDYSDHSDYSEYGDAGMIQEIENAKAARDTAERNMEEAERTLEEEYQQAMEKLTEKYGDISSDADNYQDFLQEKDQILASMREQMESEAAEAQKKVDDINQAIQQINQLQLKK